MMLETSSISSLTEKKLFLVLDEELTIVCSITQHDQGERVTVLVGLIRSHPRLYSTHLLENKSHMSMINLFWSLCIACIVFSNANERLVKFLVYIGGYKGTRIPGAHLGIQILSFSCRFRQKI